MDLMMTSTDTRWVGGSFSEKKRKEKKRKKKNLSHLSSFLSLLLLLLLLLLSPGLFGRAVMVLRG
jgi:cytoskeletal protein RodZ